MKKILVACSVAIALLMTGFTVKADDSDWLEELLKAISDVNVASTVTSVVSQDEKKKQEKQMEKQESKTSKKKSFKRACSLIVEDYFYGDFEADEIPCGCLDTCFDVSETRREDDMCDEYKAECATAENTKTPAKYGQLNGEFYGKPKEDGSRFIDDSDDDKRAKVLGASFSGMQESDFIDRPGLMGPGEGLSSIGDQIKKRQGEIACKESVKDLFHGFVSPEDVSCDCYDICVDYAGDNYLKGQKCRLIDLSCSE